MVHHGRALLVAALVVFSGCSTFAGSGPTATTAADGPAAESPEATEAESTADADGATASGSESQTATATLAETSTPAATETPTQTSATTTETPTQTRSTATGTPAQTQSTATETSGQTAATATEAPAPTPNASVEPLPPGVAANGTVDETALYAAHTAAMNESHWRLTLDGAETPVVVGHGETRFVRNGRGTFYVVGNGTVGNDSRYDDDYRFSYVESDRPRQTDGSPLLRNVEVHVTQGEYRWNGTRTANGTRLHELTLVDGSEVYLGGGLNVTGTLLVDDEGRIHDIAGEVANASDAEPYGYAFDWNVSSVPRPAFVDDVPRGVAAPTENGTAVNVTMTGGPAIPAGTEIWVEHDRVHEPVTLAEPLGPGDSLYVSVREDGDGGTVTADREPPADNATLADLSDDYVRITANATINGSEIGVEFSVGGTTP